MDIQSAQLIPRHTASLLRRPRSDYVHATNEMRGVPILSLDSEEGDQVAQLDE